MTNPCHVPLKSDQVHYWLLARTDRDNTNAAGVTDTARAVMTKWFAEVFYKDGFFFRPGKTLEGGKIDNVEILEVVRERIEPSLALGLPVVANWQNCRDQNIRLRSETKTPWWVLVRFVWRGTDAAITTWPGVRSGFAREWTAEDADWILAKAWLDEKSPVPSEQNLGDAGSIVIDKVEQTLGSVSTALTPIVSKLALLGGGLALGYWWLFRRKP